MTAMKLRALELTLEVLNVLMFTSVGRNSAHA